MGMQQAPRPRRSQWVRYAPYIAVALIIVIVAVTITVSLLATQRRVRNAAEN